MTEQEIIANAPKNWIGIKISNGFYKWYLSDDTYSEIFYCEAFEEITPIERSRADIERIAELEAKINRMQITVYDPNAKPDKYDLGA